MHRGIDTPGLVSLGVLIQLVGAPSRQSGRGKVVTERVPKGRVGAHTLPRYACQGRPTDVVVRASPNGKYVAARSPHAGRLLVLTLGEAPHSGDRAPARNEGPSMGPGPGRP